ncbi:MAG: hypothetical protein PHD87_02010 [Candidatus Cloacimonetes bacterium]|nr:hypothetical protein [Candidatus Cloacimonadota bacterium]
MTDIINIALDKFTDSTAFESLATEIMREYGYINIRQIGGTADDGQDGSHVPFYFSDSTRIKTIFQYSLEKTTYAKIKRTIKRLNEQQIVFDKFVYVTSVSLSEAQDKEIKTGIRKEFSLDIDIYDRKRVSAVLADTGNKIFMRYFPSIEDQFKSLFDDSVIMSQEREEALLRTTLIVNYSESTNQAFSSVYDYIVLSVLMGEKENGLDYTSIESSLKANFSNLDYKPNLLKASLTRLIQSNRLEKKGDLYLLTDANDDLFLFLYEQHQQPLRDIVEEVITIVRVQYRGKFDSKYIDTIYNNCMEVMIDYLRTYGIEYLNTENEKHLLSNPDLIKSIEYKASKDLPKIVSNLLMAALVEVLTNPSESVSNALTQLIYTYLSAAILNLDPELQSVSSNRLMDKEFIIDTDVLIGCVVKENPKCESYRLIIKGLIKAKCKVIIPMQSLQECVQHASYSSKTYNYFKDTLLSLPTEAVEEEVWNGFVKGYYYGKTLGMIPTEMNYEKYLRNYYDSKKPAPFMIATIIDALGKEVHFITTEELVEGINIPEEVSNQLTEKIYNAIKDNAKKASYRNEEQNKTLAKNDSDLFLCTYYLNKSIDITGKDLLAYKYYLVTSSSRIGYEAYKLGLIDRIVTKLPLLGTLLNQVCKNSISPKAFIGLLENPFLLYAMAQCKNDINNLVKAGVDLKGCSFARLRFDLDSKIHDRITMIEKCLETSDNEREDIENEVIEILEDMDDLGYPLTPKIGSIIKVYKNKVKKLDEKDKALDKYKDTVEKFSARRQKYFEKVRKGEL